MRQFLVVSALTLTVVSSTPVWAQSEPLEPVVTAAEKINQAARQSQVTIDNIAETTQARLQQYKQVNKQIDGLQVYTEQLKRQIENQQQEAQQLNLSIDEVSVVERQITPLMMRMIDGLEAFVELDVPFLPSERDDRVAGLRELMDRADVDVSEKFRRVMEAYQIETEYGRTIEVYSGEMAIEGQPQDVEFLRIGRVVLAYKTRDGSTMGIWNQSSRSWEPLPQDYLRDMNEALRIARKQLAPDLLMMPLFAEQITQVQAAAAGGQ